MLELIYGFHPVINALKNGRVKTLILLAGTKPSSVLQPYVEQVHLDYCGKSVFDQRFPGATHQHIAAICKPLPLYGEKSLSTPAPQGLYVLLDSITDPHNFGACVRSAVSYGCDGIIFTKRNRAPLNPACCKAAAGTMEWIKFIQVSNAARVLRQLKEKGYWIMAMDSEAKQILPRADCLPPLVLIMGSEGKGVRRLLMETSDYRCRIPTHSDFPSLNVSLATALSLYIIRSQQGWFN